MNLNRSHWIAAGIGSWLALTSGCSPKGTQILGTAPSGTAVSLAEAKKLPINTPTTVTGMLVEKCPEAGCWFVLKDGSGTLRVDTKTAGFVVLEVPLNRELTVSGQVIQQGKDTLLAATGVRY